MKPLCTILFFLLFVNVGCSQTKSEHIIDFLAKHPESILLVDVRTPQEYEAGHLENAQNINWFDADFAENFSEIDKDKIIYVYCKVGGRSAQAQEKLLSMGYTNVINLEGGYDAVLARKN